MPVAIYVRVSTEEQRERQSIGTQQDFAGRYCDLHQHQVFATYSDDGVTGTLPLEHRPAGIQLLSDARKRKFDQLLVFKLDRLGRDTRLILNAVAELEKYGVRVRSMTEEFDTATATGRLMLTMLSGFAAHEREQIRERSVAGTNRKVEAGAWLGGVVPYGYRKVGERGQGRLVISEEPIPGFDLSEAEVIQIIYRLSATEKKSCMKIADHLTRLGIPCNAVGLSDTGKRSHRTAPIWRPSHVRNMIANRTYMGQHVYGKRTKNPNRKRITRAVPAIVSEEVWKAAQQVLRSNRLVCKRPTKQPYLLRGLIKCGLCGLTFSGTRSKTRHTDYYYRCNGHQFGRGLCSYLGKKCNSKSLNGEYVEQLVWADIEAFLRNPGEVVERLRQRFSMQDDERQRRQKELHGLKGRLEEKTAERERMLGLFRRGRIDDATLDQHLDMIDAEAAGLQAEIEQSVRVLSADEHAAQLQSAESLLANLRERLAAPISPELKRRIIEILVEKVQADTVERWGVQQSELTIIYRFSQPNEPAALVLPRSIRISSRNRLPEKLETIGDHLLRRRLSLKLIQRQVASQLGASLAGLRSWEANRAQPEVQFMPAILRFLGYNPLPPGRTWAERLVNTRTALGLTQKESARMLRVDQGTLARWERGEREPKGEFAKRAEHFLSEGDASRTPVVSRTA